MYRDYTVIVDEIRKGHMVLLVTLKSGLDMNSRHVFFVFKYVWRVNEMDAKNKELVFAIVHCIIAIVAALLMIKGHISMYALLFLAVVLFFSLRNGARALGRYRKQRR